MDRIIERVHHMVTDDRVNIIETAVIAESSNQIPPLEPMISQKPKFARQLLRVRNDHSPITPNMKRLDGMQAEGPR